MKTSGKKKVGGKKRECCLGEYQRRREGKASRSPRLKKGRLRRHSTHSLHMRQRRREGERPTGEERLFSERKRKVRMGHCIHWALSKKKDRGSLGGAEKPRVRAKRRKRKSALLGQSSRGKTLGGETARSLLRKPGCYPGKGKKKGGRTELPEEEIGPRGKHPPPDTGNAIGGRMNKKGGREDRPSVTEGEKK